ncbi:hypothetical protein BDV12DRAFT_181540 [Aspergillus spectabilis]
MVPLICTAPLIWPYISSVGPTTAIPLTASLRYVIVAISGLRSEVYCIFALPTLGGGRVRYILPVVEEVCVVDPQVDEPRVPLDCFEVVIDLDAVDRIVVALCVALTRWCCGSSNDPTVDLDGADRDETSKRKRVFSNMVRQVDGGLFGPLVEQPVAL